jgi:hypothetical protein
MHRPIRTSELRSAVFDTLGAGKVRLSEGSFFCPAAIGKQPSATAIRLTYP